MENAAIGLECAVRSALEKSCTTAKNSGEHPEGGVLVICGGGNNGADGLALARRLCGDVEVHAVCFSEPKTDEARTQRKMAEAVGVKFLRPSEFDFSFRNPHRNPPCVVVDCLYGTGFRGKLVREEADFIRNANLLPSHRIACDIPSGIDSKGNIDLENQENPAVFNAHQTLSMGSLKASLFTDAARDFTGTISVVPLGITSKKFEECSDQSILLLEKSDLKLPARTKKSSHKGDFGHACIILGEKAGAGIIAATSALNFGAGRATCVPIEKNAGNFKMNPELMLDSKIPENATAVLCGSGLGRNPESWKKFTDLCKSFADEKPAFVFDADAFYMPGFARTLKTLNEKPNARTIITPHPKEFWTLLNTLEITPLQKPLDFSELIQNRLELSLAFGRSFPNITLVSKGAVNYIVQGGSVYVVSDGSPALAKAGSGDVLAGLCTALLAQGFSALESAKNATNAHALASVNLKNNFSLSPMKLVNLVSAL